jgi:cell division septum initiation protein DivIVA
MSMFTVLLAAITRKVTAVIAEYRKLIAEAKATEKRIVSVAKADAEKILSEAAVEEKKLLNSARNVVEFAKARERAIGDVVELATKTLYNDVAAKLKAL